MRHVLIRTIKEQWSIIESNSPNPTSEVECVTRESVVVFGAIGFKRIWGRGGERTSNLGRNEEMKNKKER